MRPTLPALCVAAVLLCPPVVLAAGRPPVVAVFDIQFKFLRLSGGKRDMLTEIMVTEMGVGGVYQVMPPGDVKKELLKQSSKSFKKCYDKKCQIELGRQLPANKLLTTGIMKIGKGWCRVAGSLYDLRRATTDITAREKSACDTGSLAKAIEKVAAKLRAWGGGEPAAVEQPAAPAGGAGDREYRRSLNLAWLALGRSARQGTSQEKLERYQKFLLDYPVDNPHAGEARKAAAMLEARLEKEDAAKRAEEERKAAIEAGRKRAREILGAYEGLKSKQGAAGELLAAWKEFAERYPGDDNPYLQTARRKIAYYEPLASRTGTFLTKSQTRLTCI